MESLESIVMIPNDGSSGEDFLSYCCQSPWVVNNTLKGNVLFGIEFDEEEIMDMLNYNLLSSMIREKTGM